MLALRNKIALRLGYKSWDDFQTEIKMAKTGAAAKNFINDLVAGIAAEVRRRSGRAAKVESGRNQGSNAKIDLWDWRYYTNQLKKETLHRR